jgi:hypothetical protein
MLARQACYHLSHMFCLPKCAFRHCCGLYVLWVCPQGFRCWEFGPQCGGAERGWGLLEAGTSGRGLKTGLSPLLWFPVQACDCFFCLKLLPRCCLPCSPQQSPADAKAVPLNLHRCELNKPLLFRKFPFHVFCAGEKCIMIHIGCQRDWVEQSPGQL